MMVSFPKTEAAIEARCERNVSDLTIDIPNGSRYWLWYYRDTISFKDDLS